MDSNRLPSDPKSMPPDELPNSMEAISLFQKTRLLCSNRVINDFIEKYNNKSVTENNSCRSLRLFHLTSSSLALLAPRLASLPGLTALSIQGSTESEDGHSLTSTPDLTKAFTSLNRLTSLDLTYNCLTSTPDLTNALSQLNGLTSLRLRENHLTSTQDLTDALSNLSELKILDVSYNKLTSSEDFGHVFRKLRHLIDLDLHCNNLTSTEHFAKAFMYLDILENLNVSGNELTSSSGLASAFIPLTNLHELNLHENILSTNKHLAKALSKLSNLHTLSLHTNRLKSTPEFARAISPLTGLKKLYLQGNLLTSTPNLSDAIKLLSSLETLMLDWNQLTSTIDLVTAFVPLTNLKSLSLTNNQLTPTHEIATLLETMSCRISLDNNPLLLPAEFSSSYSFPRLAQEIRAICDGRAQPHPEFKIVLLGEGRVGKTQLSNRLLGRNVAHDEVETRSFEWDFIPPAYWPDWPPDEPKPQDFKTQSSTIPSDNLSAVLSVFDFGGQEALWASHRFFLSCRRTIFIICASRMQNVSEARLEFWLRYVRHLWDEHCTAEAHREWNMAIARWQIGMPQPNKKALLAQARKNTPLPPAIVVLTGAPGSHSECNSDLVTEAKRLCGRFGVKLIDNYDSFEDGEIHVQTVRDLITQTVHRRELRNVWTELWPVDLLKRLSVFRREFGLGGFGLPTNPDRRLITMKQYLLEYCGIDEDTDRNIHPNAYEARENAIDDLRVLNELGVVHWVGEHPDVIGTTDRVADIIFSPAAVRGPVYNVLWAKRNETDPLTHSELMSAIRAPDHHGFDAGFHDGEIQLLIRLMEVCELIFATQRNGEREFLVPDRLPSGQELILKADVPTSRIETLLRMNIGFIPNMLMPRLIGQLWKRYRCEAMTRCSCTVYWQLDKEITPVRLCADQDTGVLRVGIIAVPNFVDHIKAVLEDMISTMLKLSPHDLLFHVISHPDIEEELVPGTPIPIIQSSLLSERRVPPEVARLEKCSSITDKQPSELRLLCSTLYEIAKKSYDSGQSSPRKWADVLMEGIRIEGQRRDKEILTLIRKHLYINPTQTDSSMPDSLKAVTERFSDACRQAGKRKRFWATRGSSTDKFIRPDGGSAGSRKPADNN